MSSLFRYFEQGSGVGGSKFPRAILSNYPKLHMNFDKNLGSEGVEGRV